MYTRIFLLISFFIATSAQALTSHERKEFLNTVRPHAELLAGQPVKFVVSQLNHQQDWYLLVGHLVSTNGNKIDWKKAKSCDPTLDKMLWIIAEKNNKEWHIQEIDICSPEPPYWYLKEEVAFSRPCKLYAGLIGPNGNIEQQCNLYQQLKSD